MDVLLGKVESVADELASLTKQAAAFHSTEEINGVLEMLCPSTIDPSQDHYFKRSGCVPNTAVWIFETSEFQQWLSSSRGVLWLHGPGFPFSE